MLLLYRKYAVYDCPAWIEFTFHYASTLSGIRKCIILSMDRFTFHYASTLSRYAKLIYPQCKIYIPLCFYFINIVSAQSAGVYLFTFHYASTLSIGSIVTIIFCIIYIPLCFYFIAGNALDSVKDFLFTFHYASTLSASAPGVEYCIILYLHYTMLLLYPGVRQCSGVRQCYLHSTMLLLYQKINTRVLLRRSFTFHYASTLSAVKECTELLEKIIYIPLCFYFIYDSLLSDQFKIHLHSTMLLLYRSDEEAHAGTYQYLHSTMLLLYRRKLMMLLKRK